MIVGLLVEERIDLDLELEADVRQSARYQTTWPWRVFGLGDAIDPCILLVLADRVGGHFSRFLE